MANYVFIVDRKELNSADRKVFEQHLKRSFNSTDEMNGFTYGYGLGKIKTLKLSDFENKLNQDFYKNHWIYFVEVYHKKACCCEDCE